MAPLVRRVDTTDRVIFITIDDGQVRDPAVLEYMLHAGAAVHLVPHRAERRGRPGVLEGHPGRVGDDRDAHDQPPRPAQGERGHPAQGDLPAGGHLRGAVRSTADPVPAAVRQLQRLGPAHRRGVRVRRRGAVDRVDQQRDAHHAAGLAAARRHRAGPLPRHAARRPGRDHGACAAPRASRSAGSRTTSPPAADRAAGQAGDGSCSPSASTQESVWLIAVSGSHTSAM